MKKMMSEDQALGNDEMLPEYDFQGGIRGKHHEAYREGHTVKVHQADGTTNIHYFSLDDGAVMLEPDVREYFSDSDAVNEALRALISLVPEEREKAARSG